MEEWYNDWLGETNIYPTEEEFVERGYQLTRLIQDALGLRFVVLYDPD